MIKDFIFEIIDIFEYSSKYMFKSEEKYSIYFQTLFLSAISLLFAPLLILTGYIVNVRKYAMKQKDEMPKLENYSDLIDESKGMLFTYSPIYIMILLSFVFMFFIPPLLIIVFICIYVLPAVGLMYSNSNHYKKTYNERFFNIIKSKIYFKIFVIYTIIMVYLLMITMIITLFTLGFGIILMIPLILYIRPIFWGYMYREKELYKL